jgi:hypothetical protein
MEREQAKPRSREPGIGTALLFVAASIIWILFWTPQTDGMMTIWGIVTLVGVVGVFREVRLVRRDARDDSPTP